ncbi:hypothetical protein SAMD00019534_018000 [Acytostelium subglobosum LB1]|uniref:hypothetical protein n=1 Tax=Acytostelium subglobosum LB1 TaxID=1410327 RepID=UPI000644F2EB|nr:hypothetical protein SAMD00019534_018000 [Acytostelium subglobosum LB1]GAM18625.1 hypothetical protein SAMD00019534_018000 [Acytostelium subglobosum LB1]|eukprot:XP_012757845.1 hypothetical protein SAMD00019534_018000 [Acytostelium subglobosum LB1]
MGKGQSKIKRDGNNAASAAGGSKKPSKTTKKRNDKNVKGSTEASNASTAGDMRATDTTPAAATHNAEQPSTQQADKNLTSKQSQNQISQQQQQQQQQTPQQQQGEQAKDNGATQEVGDDDEGPEEIIFSKNKQSVTKDDFELLTVIGKGSFGKVMQVRKKDDNKIYAMKVLRKEAIIARKQVNHTKSEKTILQGIAHPFIVNLHFAFQTRDKLYMVLDFVNGGELFFHLKREGRFSEPRVKLYAAEIVSALAHLHQQDIVYRDLKPENILLDSEGHICITDFGLSKKIETTDGTFTFCGTPEYLAPEVLNGHGHGCAVDWWSLGTLLYEMLTGLPPFYSQNVSMMYQKILNGELKIPSYISPEARSLLEGLLTREVDRRLGSKSGNDVKNHPWFKSIDWDKLDRKEIEVHFKPKVKSGNDISQIDPLFTQEKPMDSIVEGSTLSDAVNKENSFEGFTYVAESVLTK